MCLYIQQASPAAGSGSGSSAQASGGRGAAGAVSPSRDSSSSSPEPATEAQRLARVPPKPDTRAETARVPATGRA